MTFHNIYYLIIDAESVFPESEVFLLDRVKIFISHKHLPYKQVDGGNDGLSLILIETFEQLLCLLDNFVEGIVLIYSILHLLSQSLVDIANMVDST